MSGDPALPGPSLPGRYVTALGCGRRVRVQVAMLPGPAQEMCRRHRLTGSAARLAAEGLVAATLLSSQIKGEERMTVEIDGMLDSRHDDSPRFRFNADINADGRIRGRFSPASLPEPGAAGQIGEGLIFDGLISVVKSLVQRELYRGHAAARQEDFSRALQRYLTSSQQVDGRARVYAELDSDGAVSFAAGILVERLPDMPHDEFAALFDHSLQSDFRALMTAFAFGQIAGQPVEVLDWKDLVFACNCSRQRVVDMLQSLGPMEIQALILEQGRAEVTCQYCQEIYTLNEVELAELLPESA